MKRKGFTLVELLAVIAILAILVIIALPSVLKMFRNAKQNTFITEVQNLVRSAEDKYLTSSMLNGNNTCFDSSTNKLDMTGRDDLVYVIKLTNKGKVIEVKVADKSYQLIVTEENGINRADIGNKYVVQAVDSKTTIVGCDSTALKQESENKELVLKKDNEEIRTIQMGRNTTATIDKESDLSLITCNNGVEIKEENGKLKISNILSNSVCTFSNGLKNTINNLDDTQNNIFLINDLNLEEQVTINKPLTIDINGKSINSSVSDMPSFNNNSNLTIKNSSINDSSITSNVVIIYNNENCTLNLENVKIISNNTAPIANLGKSIIKKCYIEGTYGFGRNDTQTATFDIYDSEIVGTTYNGINLNSGSGASGNIYNSTITGKQHGIWSASTGTINIYSGIFTGQTEQGISNQSTGTINLIQTDKPIYVSSLATTWMPAIKNENIGQINIKGKKANKCTTVSSDTTSGICIYAVNENNGGIQNVSTGTINIDGAIIYGGKQGVNNNTTGIVNISNAKINSNNVAIYNNAEGTINICSGEISGLNRDLNNSSTGTINYTSKVILKNGTKGGTNINLTDGITCN